MVLWSLEIFYFFQRGDRLYTSESDVYRRQILTYKDGSRAERLRLMLRGLRLFPALCLVVYVCCPPSTSASSFTSVVRPLPLPHLMRSTEPLSVIQSSETMQSRYLTTAMQVQIEVADYITGSMCPWVSYVYPRNLIEIQWCTWAQYWYAKGKSVAAYWKK